MENHIAQDRRMRYSGEYRATQMKTTIRTLFAAALAAVLLLAAGCSADTSAQDQQADAASTNDAVASADEMTSV